MRLIDAESIHWENQHMDEYGDWYLNVDEIEKIPTFEFWTDAKAEKPPDGEIVIARVRLRSGRLAPYVARLEHNGTWSLQGWIYERAPIVHSWMKVPE